MENMQGRVSDYKRREATLNSRLDLLTSTKNSAEESLQQFHRKLSKIRTAVTIEVDKVRISFGTVALVIIGLSDH